MPSQKEYRANKVPFKKRLGYFLGSVFFLTYGTLGVIHNDIMLQMRSRWGGGALGPEVHLHGLKAWLLYGTIVFGCAIFIATIADHYDRRNNEAAYRRLKRFFLACAILFFLVLALYDILGQK
ncbi:MAG: hypothetical protein AB1458_06305 [Bacteroidota bacterium]